MKPFIHVCGAGGIGTSGIALLLKGAGFAVRGTDLRRSCITDLLLQSGIPVTFEPRPDWVSVSEWVSVPARFPENNPEIIAAKSHEIDICARNESLLKIFAGKSRVVGVIGSLGKALAAKALAFLGTAWKNAGWGWCVGAASRDGATAHAQWGSKMSLELDEREDLSAWLHGAAEALVISDWESDDLGYYGSSETAKLRFRQLITEARKSGMTLVYPDSDKSSEEFQTYVVENAGKCSDYRFSIEMHGYEVGITPLNVPHDLALSFQGSVTEGKALCAALSYWMECGEGDWNAVQGMLPKLEMVGWFENHGHFVHDIRMHPVSIRAALQSLARSYEQRPNLLIRPYPQTLRQYEPQVWAEAFNGVGQCCILPPYPGEGARLSESFCTALKKAGIAVSLFPTLKDAWQSILKSAGNPWLFVGGDDLCQIETNATD